MRIARTLIGAVLLSGLVATPASGTHGGIHPTFKPQNVWFHCNGPTKIYQANWAAAIGTAAAHVPWTAMPPAQSVDEGAGCIGFDWGGTTNPLYDVAFQGFFSGNLRDITIRLHQLVFGEARQTETETLRLYAQIDGVPLFPVGAQPNNGRTVTVSPVPGNMGATELFEFSITNIGYAIDVFDAEGKLIDVETGGAALEDGDGTQEHELVFYIGLHGTALGQAPQGHKVGNWVWDTTEVPSGMTFNPSTLAAAKVAADLPDFSGG